MKTTRSTYGKLAMVPTLTTAIQSPRTFPATEPLYHPGAMTDRKHIRDSPVKQPGTSKTPRLLPTRNILRSFNGTRKLMAGKKLARPNGKAPPSIRPPVPLSFRKGDGHVRSRNGLHPKNLTARGREHLETIVVDAKVNLLPEAQSTKSIKELPRGANTERQLQTEPNFECERKESPSFVHHTPIVGEVPLIEDYFGSTRRRRAVSPTFSVDLRRSRAAKEGPLLKVGGGLFGSLKSRYCILKNKIFAYYRNRGDTKVQGVLNFDLLTCRTVRLSQNLFSYRLASPQLRIEVYGQQGKCFKFQARNETDCGEWLDAIGVELEKSRGKLIKLTALVKREARFWKVLLARRDYG